MLPRRVNREIVRLDQRADTAFGRLRGDPVADRVFYAASALGDFSLVWHLLGVLRGLRGGRHEAAALRLSVLLGVESAVVNLGIKSLFSRVRPAWEEERPRFLRRPRTSSFPSGHATSAACAVVLLGEGDALWPLYVLVGGVVASSRIYVKVHHASDVIAGIPVGLAVGLLGRRMWPLPREESGPQREG